MRAGELAPMWNWSATRRLHTTLGTCLMVASANPLDFSRCSLGAASVSPFHYSMAASNSARMAGPWSDLRTKCLYPVSQRPPTRDLSPWRWATLLEGT